MCCFWRSLLIWGGLVKAKIPSLEYQGAVPCSSLPMFHRRRQLEQLTFGDVSMQLRGPFEASRMGPWEILVNEHGG